MKDRDTLLAEAPKNPSVTHFLLDRATYDQRISDGARFETIYGKPLSTWDDVKAAKRKDGEVVSR